MKVGEIIDSQGVNVTLADDELVAGVIVISKIIEADGAIRLNCAWSDGMDWITRRGLLEAARDAEADD